MAQEEKIAVNHSHRAANIAAGAALVISVLALLVATFAGRQSRQPETSLRGNTAQTDIDEEGNVSTDLRRVINEDMRLSIARAETRARLLIIRAQIASGRTGEEIVDQVKDARADLKDAYRDAQGATLGEYQAFDANLGRLEGQARTNAADALKTIEDLVSALRRDVASDDEGR